MKTINTIGSYIARTALIAALALAASGAFAQQKGAERLLPSRAKTPVSASEAASRHSSCSKCQDLVIQTPDWTTKGGQILVAGGRPVQSVAQHQCQACSTTLKTAGHGKAKAEVAHHSCTATGTAVKNCCSPVKSVAPAPGV
jgi:hypothetical protein